VSDKSDKRDTNERDLSQDALALPRELEAPRDLWAGIEARIEAKRRRGVVVRRSFAGASMLLAAAVVILSIRSLKQPLGDSRTPTPSASESLHAPAPPAPEEAFAAAVVPEETSYRTALSTLTPTFDERKKSLPEKDLAAVGKSLRAIDAAIQVTRASLLEHPEDTDLRSELDAEYEQKIDAMNDVLEWTTRS